MAALFSLVARGATRWLKGVSLAVNRANIVLNQNIIDLTCLRCLSEMFAQCKIIPIVK
jgi:hypothetical protein